MAMQSEATAVIVNPNARGGWVGRKWPVLEPVLREELGALTAHFTTRRGEGTDLCRAALSGGARLVLAMGGDGTASEVAAGFLLEQGVGAAARGPAAFGYLPCGSGGDLRKTPGTPLDLRLAARAIAAAQPRPIDVGQLDYTGHDGRPGRGYFVNIASFGIGGLVDTLVNDSGKPLGGRLAFLGASVRASMRYHNQPVSLRLDDGPPEEGRIYNVAVSNGRYFGGGMMVAPEARMDDGLFDVVTMGDLSFVQALRLGSLIYRGAHLEMPKVHSRRARKVEARPLNEGQAVLLDVDGETPGRLPATFTVLPGALLLQV